MVRVVLFGYVLVNSLLALLGYANAEESKIPKQPTPPSSCSDDDRACIKKSFDEYQNAILDELSFYDRHRQGLALAVTSGNDDYGYFIIRQAVEGGRYVHNHWEFEKSISKLGGAGISFDEANRVTWACRTAISYFKFSAIDLSQGRNSALSNFNDYVKQAAICRKPGSRRRAN